MKFNKNSNENTIDYYITDDDGYFLHTYTIFLNIVYGAPIGTMFDGDFVPYLTSFNEDDIEGSIDRFRKLLVLK